MTARARLLCVAAIVLAGAIGVISSTQTWLVVTLAGAEHELTVPGAAAVPVLAPLSLAVLALGGALPSVARAPERRRRSLIYRNIILQGSGLRPEFS